MAIKIFVFALFACSCYGAVVPVAPAAYVAPYASSYTASVVNHAVAAPVAAAPLVAAAPAPFAAAPFPAAYSAYPALAAPLIAGRR